ncbi:hypothetical protein TNCV_522781 [Trichonephila clavipes]|nr:hypothetical protein TNCV_522781 [Trichonephila clavipes]
MTLNIEGIHEACCPHRETGHHLYFTCMVILRCWHELIGGGMKVQNRFHMERIKILNSGPNKALLSSQSPNACTLEPKVPSSKYPVSSHIMGRPPLVSYQQSSKWELEIEH